MSAIKNAGPHSRGFPRKIDTDDVANTDTVVRDYQNTTGGDIAAGAAVGIKSSDLTSAQLVASSTTNFVGVTVEQINDGEFGPVAVQGPALVSIADAVAGGRVIPSVGVMVAGVAGQAGGFALEATGDTLAAHAWVWLD